MLREILPPVLETHPGENFYFLDRAGFSSREATFKVAIKCIPLTWDPSHTYAKTYKIIYADLSTFIGEAIGAIPFGLGIETKFNGSWSEGTFQSDILLEDLPHKRFSSISKVSHIHQYLQK